MKQILKFVLVLFMVVAAVTALVKAQTVIPNTVEERLSRAQQLMQDENLDSQPAKLRELAMIHSVIAGLDNPTLAATENAVALLKKAEKTNPGDYELMAAHGSVLTMMARYQKKTAQQLRYTKKGFRKMDRALKRDPDNIGALLQRANNSLNMPVFLKRAHYARRDFEHILELVGDKMGPGFKAMILFQLGQAHQLMKKNSKAEACWKMAVEMKAGYWSEKAGNALN